MSNPSMETNKWLWRPKASGPIFLRVTYTDRDGRKRQFTRSLNTNNWTKARRIRDAEFSPIILDIEKARAQLELINVLYPELEARLQTGLHGGHGQPTDSVRKTTRLADVVKAWAKALSEPNGNYATSPGTAKRYGAIVKAFVAHTGDDTDVHVISSSEIAAYRDMRLTELGKSRKTVDLELTCLRSLFTFACEKFALESNPGSGINIRMTRAETLRQKRDTRRRPPTREEADAICTRFPPHARIPAADFQDYAMVARYTGMRQAEIAHLRGADICLVGGDVMAEAALGRPEEHLHAYTGGDVPSGKVVCLHVVDDVDRQTKTGTGRIVPVADKLLPVILRRLKAAAGSKPLFPFAAEDGGANFGRVWLKKVKVFGNDLTMHGFRHYATSEMENANIGRALACAVLGHEDSSVHGGYFHQSLAAMKTAVEAIH